MEFSFLKITHVYNLNGLVVAESKQVHLVERIDRGAKWHKTYMDALWELISNCTFSSDELIQVRPVTAGCISTELDDEYDFQWVVIVYFKDDARKPIAVRDTHVYHTYRECEQALERSMQDNCNSKAVEMYEPFITLNPRR